MKSHFDFDAPSIEERPSIRARVTSWVWLTEYEVAESRDAHVAGGRNLRAAGSCAALALLALVRRCA